MNSHAEKLAADLSRIDEMISRRGSDIEEMEQECESLRRNLENDNRDEESRLRLETMEKEISMRRRKSRALEARRKSIRNHLNSLLLEEEKSRVQILQERLRELRDRKKELRQELIPAIQIQLNRLISECEEIDEQIEKVSDTLRSEQKVDRPA